MEFKDWYKEHGMIKDLMNGGPRMKRFWICVVAGEIAEYPAAFGTLVDAQNEAERKAQLPDNQGKTIHLFECIGKCRVIKPMPYWELPY